MKPWSPGPRFSRSNSSSHASICQENSSHTPGKPAACLWLGQSSLKEGLQGQDGRQRRRPEGQFSGLVRGQDSSQRLQDWLVYPVCPLVSMTLTPLPGKLCCGAPRCVGAPGAFINQVLGAKGSAFPTNLQGWRRRGHWTGACGP